MKKLFILFILVFNTMAANAVLPINTYQKEIKNSQIKAVAVVQKVKITDWEKGHQTKKVWFKTISALNKATPEQFMGYCYSFKKKWLWDKSEPMEGGQIHHYPKQGQIVFVSVSTPDGYITSYVEFDDKTQNELMKKGLEFIRVSPSGLELKN